MTKFDRLVTNVRLVRPRAEAEADDLEAVDIGIRDGKFVEVAAGLNVSDANDVVDAGGKLGFPGLVDTHMHVGIYRPLDEDARSESQAAAMGGVTSGITYIRTGQYYLNRPGPYREFFPEVRRLSEGNFHMDYAYHVAPMSRESIDELPLLLDEFGVSSYKIFMFYGGYGLHGASDAQAQFLMLPPDEKYDFAHFEFVMRGVEKLMRAYPDKSEHISLSLHCELAEIMAAYTRIVQAEGKLSGLAAYSAARPPHSEGLAIWIASYLAHETECANINLLHLSSRKALEAALMMADTLPHVNFRREVTVGHLVLDVDAPCGPQAKVNPPIRPREDVEYLWQALADGKIDWVVSDHACCSKEMKTDAEQPDEIFLAKSGFGGTEYLLSALVTEATKRGVSLGRIAELVCKNPAERFGLLSKGDVREGLDADLVLFDPNDSFVARAEDSPSAQGYTPFEGVELSGRVHTTLLRGEIIFDHGNVVGPRRGQYLHRPSV